MMLENFWIEIKQGAGDQQKSDDDDQPWVSAGFRWLGIGGDRLLVRVFDWGTGRGWCCGCQDSSCEMGER